MKYKYLILCLLCLLNSIETLSQEEGKPSKREKGQLSEKEFKNAINEKLTSYVTGSSSNIGNYASLDLKDASISFSANYILDKFQVIGFSVKGASKDGILPVFSNSSLNTGISIGFTYHKVIGKKSVFYNKYKKMYFEKVLKKEKIAHIEKKYNKQKLRLIPAEKKLDTILFLNFNAGILKKIKILVLKKPVSQDKKGSNNKEGKIEKISLNDEVNRAALIQEMEYNKEREIDAIIFSDYIETNLNWISLTGKLSKNSFKILATDEFLVEKIRDTSFTGFEFRAEFSKYKWNVNEKSYFLNFGLAFRSIDNFSSLKKIEINQSTVFQQNDSMQITQSNKFNVFQGDYNNRLSELFLYTHYYRYFDNKNKIAFHFYPRITFTEFEKPLFDIDLGILVSLKNKKKVKSVINAEIFYSLSDIGSNRSSTRKRLLDDGLIGLRFTLPFNITF